MRLPPPFAPETNYSFLFFALFFWIEGCASKNAPIETRNLSNDTPVPIHTQETTPPTQLPEETPFNTQEIPTLIQPSGKAIYDSSYLQDCRLQYSTKNDRQVGFRNVYPIFNEHNKYVGAIEISFSSESLQHYLINLSNLHSHFLIDKHIFDSKAWERDDMILKYYPSAENENLMFHVTSHHSYEKCVVQNSKNLKSQA